MAAKQMEEIQKKLATLNYPRANAPAQSLLFADLAEIAKFLGITTTVDPEAIQGAADPSTDHRLYCTWTLEEFSNLNLPATGGHHIVYTVHGVRNASGEDISIICSRKSMYIMMLSIQYKGVRDMQLKVESQGRGSYEDRMEMLRLIVDLVEASMYADNPEWSVDEQVAKDIQLIDAIAEKQAQIFSEECKLFPADVQIQQIVAFMLSKIPQRAHDRVNQGKEWFGCSLASKVSTVICFPIRKFYRLMGNNVSASIYNGFNCFIFCVQLEVMVNSSLTSYNPDEEYVEVEAKLRGHLESFLDTARTFNAIYTKEIRPWTHMMEFLGNLKNLRDSHAAVAVGSSETVAGEPSSVTRIISECETALTLLNRDLAILSASIARERGEDTSF
ncbi:nuclear matrix protein 1 [Datura stramonium]|uniref:Nuclear matrix protein 1 n=1 Tax=Datura stramonium TaxID=4076 RepID=A0ABS8S373_DATST|nr:nuclear matrix protein 1 [Datura stramonium]